MLVWSDITFAFCPSGLRAQELARRGWSVEVIRKPTPLSHLNPFELRAALVKMCLASTSIPSTKHGFFTASLPRLSCSRAAQVFRWVKKRVGAPATLFRIRAYHKPELSRRIPLRIISEVASSFQQLSG